MRVADYVMNRLVNEGVNHIFQVTGRGALFLSDAVAKHEELKSISLHHEQSCSYAAVGYAEQKKSLGACLVSTGCASTNAITGVLSAWQDGVPVIFISGQNILKETSRFTGLKIRTFGQQEADIVSLVRSITKFSAMISDPNEIESMMDKAIELAMSGRKGPVWLDIPLDIQSAQVEFDPKESPLNLKISDDRLSPNTEEVKEVAFDLASAERPVCLIGKGVLSSGAEELLSEFVERWGIPLTFTPSASDIFGAEHDLSIGSVGSMGCSRAGNFAVANSDYLLVLGSRLNSLTTGADHCKFAREAKITVVDIDPIEHSKETIKIDSFIQSDISSFLEDLQEYAPSERKETWLKQCFHWKNIFAGVENEFKSEKEIDLYELSSCFSESLPFGSTLVTDSGLIEVILPSNIGFRSGVRCIHPASQGAMGFALPAAIGVQMASDNPVITVIGDGSIMMNLQELESIRYQSLPIKIIVINNNVYSIIRRRQKDLFRRRTIGTDPENGVSCPDFSSLADCFGLSFLKIERTSDLKAGINEMFDKKGPVLCEIIGREDQNYIEVGQAKSLIEKKFVRRPLEDQQPFLSRKKFLAEMVIDPIDQ
ncbi:MAG: thiamine pyrophosphate-binding protein [Flavobacteriaceae bacterium]|nr:thiamine pyrophosphate-binding protein [Flavobacteriaceae bacterium]|tara:strand:- start:16347 stop:18137 length:1791 start_codon:yes stop_codon:yes gene_type:complete